MANIQLTNGYRDVKKNNGVAVKLTYTLLRLNWRTLYNDYVNDKQNDADDEQEHYINERDGIEKKDGSESTKPNKKENSKIEMKIRDVGNNFTI